MPLPQILEPGVTSRRTYDLVSGNKIHAERKDPYGMIYIHFDKGKPPEELEGAYTSYDEADKAIQLYLNKTNKYLKDIEPQPDA
jgi:hypothetical protein